MILNFYYIGTLCICVVCITSDYIILYYTLGHTSHACRACMRGIARTHMSNCSALKACFEGM